MHGSATMSLLRHSSSTKDRWSAAPDISLLSNRATMLPRLVSSTHVHEFICPDPETSRNSGTEKWL